MQVCWYVYYFFLYIQFEISLNRWSFVSIFRIFDKCCSIAQVLFTIFVITEVFILPELLNISKCLRWNFCNYLQNENFVVIHGLKPATVYDFYFELANAAEQGSAESGPYIAQASDACKSFFSFLTSELRDKNLSLFFSTRTCAKGLFWSCIV